MEVVILSAGRGTRIGADKRYHISYIPKPLLPLNGETVIQRQIRLIKECGETNIKIVAGENKNDIQKILKDYTIQYYETNTNHKNALYELADLCRVTKEKEKMFVLLGDTVFSKDAIKEMLTKTTNGITVFTSEPTKELWCPRDDEVFAITLTQFYIQIGRTLFGSMPDLYYELKNIPKQLNIQTIKIKECCDIDQYQDYIRVLFTLHKTGK